jgi:glucose/arabinose dehydrogenase
VRRWTCALLAAVMGTAACGSDDAPDASFATVPAAAATTDDVVPSTAPTDTVDTVDTTLVAAATTVAAPTTPAPTEPLGDPVVGFADQGSDDRPVDLAVRPGDDRPYIANQDGTITRFEGGGFVPVLDLTDLTSADGERGLLGLAFHPTDPLAYVNYTDNDGNTAIAEYAVGADGSIDAGSARIVLQIEQPYANHNGGDLAFGPDGYLYIGTGDGGSANDPERYSLNTASLLGKMLRIDPRAAGSDSYSVPPDNPFLGVDGARPEVWSVGLRNPWRFSFDAATGDVWMGDVGQDEWEEVSVGWADGSGLNPGRGLNFGWSAWEGNHRFNEDQPEGEHTPPIHEYAHGDDTGCSISGGTVYRGSAIPALVGWYVYADYCSGQVRALQIADRAVVKELVLTETFAVTNIAADADGELWVLAAEGPVFQIVPG